MITASIAYQYAKEAFPEDTSFLKLGLTYPLPMDLIRDFASKVETLYVIEELDSFMEDEIKAAGIACIGKELTGRLYELNPQLLKERIFGQKPETVDGRRQGRAPRPGAVPRLPPQRLLLHHGQAQGLCRLRRYRLLHSGLRRTPERSGLGYLHGRRLYRRHGYV